ncbi:thioredoxin domain-containing protein 17-like [Gigantopelta aegis]|uniref:thioredoxin domain-containing protein 17-like n=1 Tax=Gigantopelta aegis TaxID=1735272 RepID=UPI001B887DE9|nr:thioredoxin domain-containing protein 17-like [Gigantopelta aegis]
MVQKINIEGHDAYCKALEEHKGKTLFALFCGNEDPATGKSWCPDCVVAEPVVERNLKHVPDDAVLIHCSVGDRPYWKDQNNAFRTDPKLKLKSVPTLMKVGTPQRLEEEQCTKDDLIQMLFED